jgi:cytochrome P450
MSEPLPGPGATWLLRHARLLSSQPVAFFSKLAEQFGDFVCFPMGSTRFHLVNDPELVQELLIRLGPSLEKFPKVPRSQGLFGEGLLTSEEPLHMRQRRLIQPGFHRDRISGYADVMVRAAEERCAQWRAGETIDVAEEMNRFALDVVSRALFSADTRAEAEPIAAALETIVRMLNRLVLPPGPLLLQLPLSAVRKYRAAIQQLDEVIYRILAQRRSRQSDEQDLLGMLLAARDPETGEPMPDLQLRDEVVTIFVAGHDTSANALAWAWHLIGAHPEVEAAMHREFDEVLGGRAPSFEDYPKLRFTEAVLSESMRLYPPVWILGRRPLTRIRLGGIDAGPESVFLVCMYALHRREASFAEPLRFDPWRWLGEAEAPRHKFAYLPFGAGSRLCVGERFAWMEGVLALATIGRRWRLAPEPGHPVEPLALITLRPKHGLRMSAHPR